MPTFNLITQPWIPVREGSALRLVGLEEALLNARRFRRIEDPSPLVTAALHRLLLAILHRALEGPQDAYEAAGWFSNGFDAKKIRDYLAKHHDRFDLFHPNEPFYQVPDFTLERSRRSWTVLAPELNSDNNKVLFDHTVTSRPRPLHPAEAARLLVANQTFALSAGKSVLCHTATAPVATAALVIVLGESLHETLCLNLVGYPKSEYARDFAIWEQAPLQVADLANCEAAKATPKGIVHRYTWLSRAVRLNPETENGETVVRWIAYASGVRYEEAAVRPDPMVAFRPDPKDPAKLYTLAFREGRALWRDFASLLPRPGSEHSLGVVEHARNVYRALGARLRGRGIPVMAAGQANDKQAKAKIKLWRGEVYRLPEAILSDKDIWRFVEENLERAEEMGRALDRAAFALAKELLSLGGRQPSKEDVNNLVQSFPHQIAYWSALEAQFAAWIEGLGLDFEQHQSHLEKRWQEVLEREALRAWRLTVLAVGDDARALRAVHKSEGVLLGHIHKQKEVTGASK
ncbi:CRISPR-associated protein CasA/Cse1 [Meiothermus luteus]|uniref:CRISPR-associated protein CasA/Cse1 n=1 Tax=Meiothermus luteus TaxID=2026184 RepID=A0A399EP85_9DEIN|nr:type I-E CRISPR-associated protein Cse1/CasA [Meiothermus luteus]RIH85406.1 CRISPR-associated protein CasA/Cse1 [Meiothermus luteus]RMH53440.1 MAG: type I-E CRISPR-associated protein Cse1/CasA [Deinococcota bacterium]